ncbi:hypothetical protein POJ06DRAFT_207762 [Lipomyces tetrasporus]|uniref:Protein-tyrosine-phosphatase n=1 Tax=Lipomyces tetrasporus TaxID=54092 RepID=A0AAD7VVG0_9ASCO|nr:uncharacterized protein POJ06DRAFT_207762 [Lipomyces tetrasporus]KAJ8102175.1 hypothetical protein POJ06DRAFT_207762 [Lipomyces tetrasporus]
MAALAVPRPASPDPSSMLGTARSPVQSAPATPPASPPLSSLENRDPLDLSMSSFSVASHDFDGSIHAPQAQASLVLPDQLPRQQPAITVQFQHLLEFQHQQHQQQHHHHHHHHHHHQKHANDQQRTVDSSSDLAFSKSQSLVSVVVGSPCLAPQSPSRSLSPISLSPRLPPSPPLSLLFPAVQYPVISTAPPVRGIRASQLADAISYAAHQPLPHAQHVFPWLHGLHPENELQLTFLDPSWSHVNACPSSFRNITLVKLGGLGSCKLRGTVSHKEFLPDVSSGQEGFLNLDPLRGVGLRNFDIQVAKVATLSDIVVYSKKGQPTDGLLGLAKRISQAQLYHRSITPGCPEFNTFIVLDPFEVFEQQYPELVAVASNGKCHEFARDFLYHERREMSAMSAASEVTAGVYLGNVADMVTEDESCDYGKDDIDIDDESGKWDIYIECISQARIPTTQDLAKIDENLFDGSSQNRYNRRAVHLYFPSSGSLALGNMSDRDLDAFVDFCEWVLRHATVNRRRILLFCQDGYTETSLLGLAYLMYTTGVSAAQAYVDMHVKYKRAFFTFPADLIVLNHLQTRLLLRSPVENSCQAGIAPELPQWFMLMDGSLPSKIFPHMYLGNLGHANNPGLLKQLGIKRILSIGEVIEWRAVTDEEYEMEKKGGGECDSDEMADCGSGRSSRESTVSCAGREREPVPGFSKMMYVDQIQDDGIDSLSRSIEDCLAFIDEGHRLNEPTLVHCRVGVSRSATICIAEVMRRERMSLPRAYLFVRARRLNVIIQPNLRFMYELMKWEEEEAARRGASRHRRDMEWALLCKEIAAMNKAYIPG